MEEALGLEKRVVGDAEPGGETVWRRWRCCGQTCDWRSCANKRGRSGTEHSGRAGALNLRARQSGIEGLYRPVQVFLSWAHRGGLDLQVAAPGNRRVSDGLGAAVWSARLAQRQGCVVARGIRD